MTVFELDLPWTAPPLSLNHRRHWRANAAKVRQVRDAAHLLAKQARIGPCPRVRVTLHYRPRDRRTRDEENGVPTLKACCDGIVDAGVVPDDAPAFMVKDMPVLHEPSSVTGLPPRLWLVVEPLSAVSPSSGEQTADSVSGSPPHQPHPENPSTAQPGASTAHP